MSTDSNKNQNSPSSSNKRELELISPSVQSRFQSNVLYVLRSSRNHKAIEVSLTQDGLKWVTDTKGEFIYFKNADLRVDEENGRPVFAYFVERSPGGLQPSKNYYVERFIPRDHYRSNGTLHPYLQGVEYLACKKGLSILTPINERDFAHKDEIVWSTAK